MKVIATLIFATCSISSVASSLTMEEQYKFGSYFGAMIGCSDTFTQINQKDKADLMSTVALQAVQRYQLGNYKDSHAYNAGYELGLGIGSDLKTCLETANSISAAVNTQKLEEALPSKLNVIGQNHPLCKIGRIVTLIEPHAIECRIDTDSNGTLGMVYNTKVYGEPANEYSKYVNFTFQGELNESNNHYLIDAIKELVLLNGSSIEEALEVSKIAEHFPTKGQQLFVSSNVRVDTPFKRVPKRYGFQVFLK